MQLSTSHVKKLAISVKVTLRNLTFFLVVRRNYTTNYEVGVA